jgi:hypothetical protein
MEPEDIKFISNVIYIVLVFFGNCMLYLMAFLILWNWILEHKFIEAVRKAITLGGI